MQKYRINNRDLSTFKTDIATTEALIKKVPEDKIIVSESGINTKEDIKGSFLTMACGEF